MLSIIYQQNIRLINQTLNKFDILILTQHSKSYKKPAIAGLHVTICAHNEKSLLIQPLQNNVSSLAERLVELNYGKKYISFGHSTEVICLKSP